FFFSSRRRHTRFSRDWSSDVCSSDLSFASPSIVKTPEPSQDTASVVQDFTARPSTCTMQAPHWLVSQPTCVPVRRRYSRRNWTRSVRGSMSADTLLPFTVIVTWVMHFLPHVSLKGFCSETEKARQQRHSLRAGHAQLMPRQP